MKIDISDHALIRWLERVHDIDMEFFRDRIRDEIAPAIAMGASSVKMGGMKFAIANGVLTTVMHAKKMQKAKPPRQRAGAEEEFA